MRLTEEQIQAAATRASQLYGKLAKVLLRGFERVPVDEYASAAQEVEASCRLGLVVLELLAARLTAIAEVAEVAGPDDETLVILLRGMLAPSADG